ncbi:MAG: hypothetical protein R3B36_33160 [Polyangiaceae bacterium]
MSDEPELLKILRLAPDEVSCDDVRGALVELRAAEQRYAAWCVSVKRGERKGDIEATLLPILDRDDEVVLAWKEYCASRNDESTAALVHALRAATEERLRIARDL